MMRKIAYIAIASFYLAGYAHAQEPAAPAPAPAPVAAAAPADVEGSAATSAVQEQAPSSATENEPAPVELEGAEETIIPYRSVMFNVAELRQLREAARTYSLKKQRDAEEAARRARIARGETAPDNMPLQEKRSIRHPQFYLSSIAYRHATDWSVWINNTLYTPTKAALGELSIVSVSATKAQIAWSPDLYVIYAGRVSEKPDARISLDEENKRILFTLYPNQTFSAYSMRVEEGWRPPMHEEQLMVPANTQVPPTIVPSAPPARLPEKPAEGASAPGKSLLNAKPGDAKLPAVPASNLYKTPTQSR